MSECATVSAAVGEPLGGTGMVADRWPCVESRAAWGRDAIAEGGFAPGVEEWLEEVDANVLSLIAHSEAVVTFASAAGDEISRRVAEREGPFLAKSCGAEPEQLSTFTIEEIT